MFVIHTKQFCMICTLYINLYFLYLTNLYGLSLSKTFNLEIIFVSIIGYHCYCKWMLKERRISYIITTKEMSNFGNGILLLYISKVIRYLILIAAQQGDELMDQLDEH